MTNVLSNKTSSLRLLIKSTQSFVQTLHFPLLVFSYFSRLVPCFSPEALISSFRVL